MRVALLFLITLTSLISACTTPQSPREAFLTRCPDRANYANVYEVSPEFLRGEDERMYRNTKSQVAHIRDTIKDDHDSRTLERQLVEIEKRNETVHKSRLQAIEQVEKFYNPKTDSLLFFRHSAGNRQETVGYLITRNGVVQKRITFGEDARMVLPGIIRGEE